MSEPGIYFNQKTLTFVLGVIALGTTAIGGVTYFNNQARDMQQVSAEVAKLTEEVSGLKSSVTDMALAVRELQVRQEQTAMTTYSYPQQSK